MTTGYITCYHGRLTAESTIVIDGAEYPIPELSYGSVGAEFRIRQALQSAGYRTDGPYEQALSPIDKHGGYEIRVVKA